MRQNVIRTIDFCCAVVMSGRLMWRRHIAAGEFGVGAMKRSIFLLCVTAPALCSRQMWCLLRCFTTHGQQRGGVCVWWGSEDGNSTEKFLGLSRRKVLSVLFVWNEMYVSSWCGIWGRKNMVEELFCVQSVNWDWVIMVAR